MSVLITGAGGFIGRALTRALACERGVRVIALDRQLDGFDLPSVQPVTGDFSDAAVRDAALAHAPDALIHLAAVPGGAAEVDPDASLRINLAATAALFNDFARRRRGGRVVYASTIAVYGESLPTTPMDEAAPVRPHLVYGAHKAMTEVLLAALTRRGETSGLSLRLPGIVARPAGGGGMKSAFMSDVFHALAADRPFVCPVSADATVWLMSVQAVVSNLLHALALPVEVALADHRAVQLPVVHCSMASLVDAIAAHTGTAPARVTYAPDVALERAFGGYPGLSTPQAEALGFHADGSVAALVAAVLGTPPRER